VAAAFGLLPTGLYIAFLLSLLRPMWKLATRATNVHEQFVAAGLFVTLALNGVLMGLLWPVAVGGYQRDGTFMRDQFPSNQQAIWSFVVLGIAALLLAHDRSTRARHAFAAAHPH
jgi:hypothetical protein